MPNAADYFAKIAATENPIEGDLNRLTQSLMGIHERKLARARQAEMDRMAAEREARADRMAAEREARAAAADEQDRQIGEDKRELDLFEIKKRIEGQKDAELIAQERELAGPPAEKLGEEGASATDAGFGDTLTEPTMVRAPTKTMQFQFGGETLEGQLPSRTENMERDAEDFARKLVQEGQISGARRSMVSASGKLAAAIGVPEGTPIPEDIAQTVLGRIMTAGQPIEVSPGATLASPQEGGGFKGVYTAPGRPVPTSDTGLTPTANRNLMSITTKFQADKVMAIAGQGKIMKGIADQVLANPASAPNQLKSLYILIKNLDPNSAALQGELNLAQATQSYLQQWQNSLDRISKGVVISPQAAAELATATKEIADLWDIAAQRRQKQYQAQAGIFGVGSEFESYLASYGGGASTSASTGASTIDPAVQERLNRYK